MIKKIKMLELKLMKETRRVEKLRLQLELLKKQQEEKEEAHARKAMQDYRLAQDKQIIGRINRFLSFAVLILVCY